MLLGLNMVLPDELHLLAALFKSAGFSLYVVGGAVRDAVMGVEPKDYDVATDATPDQVLNLLGNTAWKTDEVGKSFGVVRARSGGEEYEIATFRQDIGEGRRPDSVVFTSIEEDVKRRDLTINALFYDIANGEVVDLVGGIEDINNGIIRTVGDPEDRFREDRLRVLRAIRFAAKLDFKIEHETYRAIERDNHLDGVSFERIHDELIRTLSGAKNSARLMHLMDGLDMWKRVLPGLDARSSPVGTFMRLVNTSSVPVALALLLDREDPETLGKKLNYLKYSAEEVAQVTFLLRYRDLEASRAYRIRKLFNAGHVGPGMLSVYANNRSRPVSGLVRAFDHYVLSQPVRGEDLMAQGYSGRELGMELERRETELFKELL